MSETSSNGGSEKEPETQEVPASTSTVVDLESSSTINDDGDSEQENDADDDNENLSLHRDGDRTQNERNGSDHVDGSWWSRFNSSILTHPIISSVIAALIVAGILATIGAVPKYIANNRGNNNDIKSTGNHTEMTDLLGEEFFGEGGIDLTSNGQAMAIGGRFFSSESDDVKDFVDVYTLNEKGEFQRRGDRIVGGTGRSEFDNIAMSLADDGTTLMIFNQGDEINPSNATVQVYEYDTTSWKLVLTLHQEDFAAILPQNARVISNETRPSQTTNYQVESLSSARMSGNGRYIAIGANVIWKGTEKLNMVQVFDKTNIIDSIRTNSNVRGSFVYADGRLRIGDLAISAKGEALLTGGWKVANGYKYGGTDWLGSQVLVSNEPYGGDMTAAVSHDGTVAAVLDSRRHQNGGKLFMFEYSGGARQWKQLGQNITADSGMISLDRLALSGDGMVVASGFAQRIDDGAFYQLSFRVFRYNRTNDLWELIDTVGGHDFQPSSCDLSFDGSNICCVDDGILPVDDWFVLPEGTDRVRPGKVRCYRHAPFLNK